MNALFLIVSLQSAHANFDGSQYAPTELGAPKNPPHRPRPWLWIIPVGIAFFIGAGVLSLRR
ncbi:MAG: hypothetical protein VX278_01200 [Myxococcota bacterium]|nr:hypothetical protein [Myxococcota bacterium]